MITGITIRNTAANGKPFTLQSLAAMHPLWAEDIAALGLVEDSSEKSVTSLKGHNNSDVDVIIVDGCTSTMELAADYGRQGILAPWGAVLAVRQESGRGQLRRQWISGPGNLHVSYLLPSLENHDPLWNRLLPLLLGWCVQKGLLALGAKTILKWPNDLLQLHENGLLKTCGLLIEDRAGRTIGGTGINIATAPLPHSLREGAAFHAGILTYSSFSMGPLRLWAKLVKEIKKEYLALLDNSNPLQFTEQVEQKLLWMGEKVALHDGNVHRPVTLLGLARDGGLRILGDSGEEIIYSGSISNIFQADACPDRTPSSTKNGKEYEAKDLPRST